MEQDPTVEENTVPEYSVFVLSKQSESIFHTVCSSLLTPEVDKRHVESEHHGIMFDYMVSSPWLCHQSHMFLLNAMFQLSLVDMFK